MGIRRDSDEVIPEVKVSNRHTHTNVGADLLFKGKMIHWGEKTHVTWKAIKVSLSLWFIMNNAK